MGDPLVGQLRDVDQAFDAILDSGERAKVGELGHRPANELANLIGGSHPAPRLGLGSLDRESDLLFLGVDAQDVDIDLVTDPQHLTWVPDAAPGQLGEVDEPVRPTNVHEGAEVADGGDPALTNLALLQLLDQPLLHHIAAFLDGLPLGEDQPVAMAIDLDDFQRQHRADQARHVGLLARVVAATDLGDLGGGHEAAHPVQVHQQATLVVVGDLRLDDLVRLVQLLQPPPALLLPGAVDTDDCVPLVVLWLHDEDEDGVPDGEVLPLLGGQRGVLPSRDDALGLRPDIDQQLLAVDVHHDAVHDIPVLQGLVVMTRIVEELLHERGTVHGLHSGIAVPVGRIRLRHCRCGVYAGDRRKVLVLANIRAVHTPSLDTGGNAGTPPPMVVRLSGLPRPGEVCRQSILVYQSPRNQNRAWRGEAHPRQARQ